MYVQVNIGRHVTDEGPLTTNEWADFQADVKHALSDLVWDLTQDHSGVTIERHLGEGVYLDYTEQSAHFSFFVPIQRVVTKPTQTAAAMTSFTRALRVLAREYRQDSIALIAGSRLIKAQP